MIESRIFAFAGKPGARIEVKDEQRWSFLRFCRFGMRIAIAGSDGVQAGCIQRVYTSFWSRLVHYSPVILSFLETVHIDGESDGIRLRIREQSFKSNLKKLKWDVFLQDDFEESRFQLEDRTKISTSPRMVYHKNGKEFLFTKDLFNRTCEVSLHGAVFATVRLDKKIPPSLRAVNEFEDITTAELFGIYYVISLVY